MKQWTKSRLTSVAFWAGLFMVIGSLLFPRSFFLLVGLALLFTPDDTLRTFFSKHEKKISDKIDAI